MGAKVGGIIVKNYDGTLEVPNVAAQTALQNIASTPSSEFFYDLPNPTSLTGIFQQIAADIAGGTARIIQ